MSHPLPRNRSLDLKQRLCGASLILAAGGLSLLHRHIAQRPQTDIGDIAQMVLVLAGMIVASLGVLLIFGARLLADECDPARKPVRRESQPRPHRHGRNGDTEKVALATFLARRAEAAAQRQRD